MLELPAHQPPPRETVDSLVLTFYHTKLLQSPHQSDAIKRNLAPNVFEVAQALIVSESYDDLCALPLHSLSHAPKPVPHSRTTVAASLGHLLPLLRFLLVNRAVD